MAMTDKELAVIKALTGGLLNLEEAEIADLVNKSLKANKYIINKKILKTIFVKNKIINYIVKNWWKKP